MITSKALWVESVRCGHRERHPRRGDESLVHQGTLALLPSPKAYARRASAYLATEKLDECLADYDKILELDADNTQYKQKRKQLAKQIDERNEKLKAEMIGKLKEVGNKVLGKFGMSLDNFKMVQDPATGGYSIKYEKWTVCHKHDTKRITLSAEWGSPAPPPTARG